jgi:hypothetical protein
MIDFLLLPFVEIEIRFGTFSKKFDSSIDKKYFNEIKENLISSRDVFKNIENKNTLEYINCYENNKNSVNGKNKNLKLISSSNSKNTLIMKENVLNKTFSLNSSPFDIRLSINQEFLLNTYISSFKTNNSIIRKKERISFIDSNYQYDLTIVNETINNITKEKYEIEIELLVNKDTLTWTKEYINDFIECKIYDLVNIVEPIERNTFKIQLF